MNAFRTWLKICHEELRQFWRQKEVQLTFGPFTVLQMTAGFPLYKQYKFISYKYDFFFYNDYN